MYRVICIAILIVGLHAETTAQNPLFPAGGSNFDPVVFLSTLKINQHYGHGKIRPPQGTSATRGQYQVEPDDGGIQHVHRA